MGAREAPPQRLAERGRRGEPRQRRAGAEPQPPGSGGRALSAPQSERIVEAALAPTRIKSLFAPIVDLIELLGALIVIGLGTWALTRGDLTLGGRLVFLIYLIALWRAST